MKYKTIFCITSLFLVFLNAPTLEGSSLPENFFIQMNLEDKSESVVIWFSNWTFAQVKTVVLEFTAIHQIKEEWNLNFSVKTDKFARSVQASAIMENGQLTIDSKPTIFKINPTKFNYNRTIVFSQTPDFSLEGNVTAYSSLSRTNIGRDYIKTSVVQAFHINKTGQATLPLVLGYDRSTGLLVYSGMAISDILLKLCGIEYLVGDPFLLTAYSSNLQFELVTMNPPAFSWFSNLGIFGIGIFSLGFMGVIIAFYYSMRKNKRRDRFRGKSRKKYTFS